MYPVIIVQHLTHSHTRVCVPFLGSDILLESHIFESRIFIKNFFF